MKNTFKFQKKLLYLYCQTNKIKRYEFKVY